MSDNTFWTIFNLLLAIVILGFFSILGYGTMQQNKDRNERFQKCIAEQMQYIDGNCVIGKVK